LGRKIGQPIHAFDCATGTAEPEYNLTTYGGGPAGLGAARSAGGPFRRILEEVDKTLRRVRLFSAIFELVSGSTLDVQLALEQVNVLKKQAAAGVEYRTRPKQR
jgi:hypothetical protein